MINNNNFDRKLAQLTAAWRSFFFKLSLNNCQSRGCPAMEGTAVFTCSIFYTNGSNAIIFMNKGPTIKGRWEDGEVDYDWVVVVVVIVIFTIETTTRRLHFNLQLEEKEEEDLEGSVTWTTELIERLCELRRRRRKCSLISLRLVLIPHWAKRWI